jgi:hypothetical protein
MSYALARRPGLVTFAAIMMCLAGGFQLTWGFVEFANAVYLNSTVYGSFGGHLWLWGIFDIVLAMVSFYVAYEIMMGGRFGFIFGIVIASLSALRWFFYLPAVPMVAIVMLAVDVLVIYGLVAHADYFSSPNPAAMGAQNEPDPLAAPHG